MQITFDPWISEWGNPSRKRYGAKTEPTRGTETSKYPEEKKIIMIPSVVASESGRAQTDTVTAASGLKDYNTAQSREAESIGKSSQRK